jgi:hypothetical protein
VFPARLSRGTPDLGLTQHLRPLVRVCRAVDERVTRPSSRRRSS